MIKFFKALIFDFRLRHCRREANRRRALTGKKYLVITLNGRPLVISKQRVRQLIHEGVYKKGVTAADIEALAIYKTV